MQVVQNTASQFLTKAQSLVNGKVGRLKKVIKCVSPEWLEKYYSFNAIFSNSDQEEFDYEGYGDDLKEEVSLSKAVAEGMERFCVRHIPKKVMVDWHQNIGGPTLPVQTSGVAAHPNPQQAVERALLELIERDALFIRWFGNIPPCRIENGRKLNHKILTLLNDMQEFGFSVSLYDLSLDIQLPIIGAMGYGLEEKSYGISFGIGTAFDVEEALEHALLELSRSLLASMADAKWQFSRRQNAYKNRYYHWRDSQFYLKRFFNQTATRSMDDLMDQWKICSLDSLVSYLAMKDWKIYYTLINVESIREDIISVIKVLSGNFQCFAKNSDLTDMINWQRLGQFGIKSINNNMPLPI